MSAGIDPAPLEGVGMIIVPFSGRNPKRNRTTEPPTLIANMAKGRSRAAVDGRIRRATDFRPDPSAVDRLRRSESINKAAKYQRGVRSTEAE